MKSLLFKLLPGAAATIAALLLATVFSHAQDNNLPAATPQQAMTAVPLPTPILRPRPMLIPQAAPASTITICGACGAQLEQPQTLMIAQPVRGSFYGMPPVGFVKPCGYQDNCDRIQPRPLFNDPWRRRVQDDCGQQHYHGRRN